MFRDFPKIWTGQSLFYSVTLKNKQTEPQKNIDSLTKQIIFKVGGENKKKSTFPKKQ